MESSARDAEAKINSYACGHSVLSQQRKQLINPFSLINSTMMKNLWRMGLSLIFVLMICTYNESHCVNVCSGSFPQVFVYSFFSLTGGEKVFSFTIFTVVC